ncbi:MAG: EF-hand domain-containing protein [Xanthomonadales bacterium]|nr:EF-hand domain-containing protein [Xanthomonadales bacterium]
MSFFKPVFAGILAAGLAWFTPAGYANEAEEPEAVPKPSFETVDANLDGVITPSEAEGSWLAAVFTDIDVNQDGIINRNEYETAIS